jgi:hypothetical protein
MGDNDIGVETIVGAGGGSFQDIGLKSLFGNLTNSYETELDKAQKELEELKKQNEELQSKNDSLAKRCADLEKTEKNLVKLSIDEIAACNELSDELNYVLNKTNLVLYKLDDNKNIVSIDGNDENTLMRESYVGKNIYDVFYIFEEMIKSRFDVEFCYMYKNTNDDVGVEGNFHGQLFKSSGGYCLLENNADLVTKATGNVASCTLKNDLNQTLQVLEGNIDMIALKDTGNEYLKYIERIKDAIGEISQETKIKDSYADIVFHDDGGGRLIISNYEHSNRDEKD